MLQTTRSIEKHSKQKSNKFPAAAEWQVKNVWLGISHPCK